MRRLALAGMCVFLGLAVGYTQSGPKAKPKAKAGQTQMAQATGAQVENRCCRAPAGGREECERHCHISKRGRKQG